MKGSLPAIALLVIGLGSAVRHGPVALIGTFASAGAIVLLAMIWAWVYKRSVRIAVDDVAVRLTSWRRRETTIPRDELGGLALRDLPGAWGQHQRLLILYDKHRGCQAAFDRMLWRDEDVRRLEDELCGGHPHRARLTSVQELAREFPGSVAWWKLHGTVVGVTLALVGIALVSLMAWLLK